MEKKNQPDPLERATHFPDIPLVQSGGAPSPDASFPFDLTIHLSLAQDDLALLRRVFTVAESLLTKHLQPPQPLPVSPPPIIEQTLPMPQALPKPSEQPELKTEPPTLTVVEPQRRRQKPKEQAPLT